MSLRCVWCLSPYFYPEVGNIILAILLVTKKKTFKSIVGKVMEVKLKFNTATSISTSIVWMYETAAGNNTHR